MNQHVKSKPISSSPNDGTRFAAAPAINALLLATVLLGGVTKSLAQAAASLPRPSSPAEDPSSSLNHSINPGSTTDLPDDDPRLQQSPAADRVNTSTMPASRIIALLEQRPEVVVELKEFVADWMRQQGTEIQGDGITDEKLFNLITSRAALRAHISTFLRARGYVSPDDLPSEASGVQQGDIPQNSANDDAPSQDTGESRRDGLNQTDTSSPLVPGNAAPVKRHVSALSDNTSPAANRHRAQQVNGSTNEPMVLRSPAPYNLQAMRDLYTQIPEQSTPLKRFGSEVFLGDGSSASPDAGGRDTPLDVPLGPDYIVGPGDTLTITVWGGVTQTITRKVDRDGRILLPEGGSLDVAGLSLGRVQDLIQSVLKQQFRNAHISVTVSQLRSVRVYVVGDVQRPGGFDVSALATPLSALLAAGGPTSVGSLRTLRHFRGMTLVEEVDLYDFLLHGVRKESARFEAGDTLLVPPAGPQVAISGAVKRPAIYELKSGVSSLASVIEDAGGFTAAASLSNITIERIDANRRRETVTVNLTEAGIPQSDSDRLAAFEVRDQDRIHLAPILPYSERVIYLEGHVARPGRQPYVEGMRLSDVLHSYKDMLPEPAAHAEIVRLVPPDLHAETIAFDVPDVLLGNGDVNLRPFDSILIFGRYEVDAPTVTVHGEVLRPGTYPLSTGMTAAQLVRMAGGFRRDALLELADLTSYTAGNGSQVIGSLRSVPIGAAVSGTERSADVPLKPGDILTIHQITGWDEIGEAVTIQGQVAFPGSYGFKEGERLSSIVRRAGGFRETAYPSGAVLVRNQVRDLEQKSRQELIRQIETSSAAARLSPTLAPGDSAQTLQLVQTQQDQVLARLKSEPPNGRLVIHISSDIDTWANTDADIELRRGDVLTIPKRPGFVLVTGQVYNATALTFTPGRTAGWYLQHAGGTNTTANRKEIFVIRANGSVIGRHSGGWFDNNVLATRLDAGDVVVVPQRVIGGSLFWRNLLTTAQLASSIAITAAVAGL